MEDLNKLLKLSETFPMQLEEMTEDFLLKLRVILWGQAAIIANKEKVKGLTAASPQQTLKRVKRLSLLNEDTEAEDKIEIDSTINKETSARKSRRSNDDLLAVTEDIDVNNVIDVLAPVAAPRTQIKDSLNINGEKDENAVQEELRKSEATNLMPPPPAPVVAPAEDTLNKRPQRAAKLKSEKNLKEQTLKTKLRRPTEEVKIKLEHEQRASQMHEATTSTALLHKSNDDAVVKSSLSSNKSDDSVLIVPGKTPSIVSINSDTEDVSMRYADNKVGQQQRKSSDSADNGTREIRIKIKREKISLDNHDNLSNTPSNEAVFKAPMALPPLAKNETTAIEETSLANSLLSLTTNTTSTATGRKTRKKKDVVHKPIKVERFSDLDRNSRTRHGSGIKTNNKETAASEEPKRAESIYEDAVEAPQSSNTLEVDNATVADGVVNETDGCMNFAASDATFCTNTAQATFQVTTGRTTFIMDSNPNTTVTLSKNSRSSGLADATFDVNQVSKIDKDKEDDAVGQRSFETAKSSSMPDDNSLLTEDEQEKPIITRATRPKALTASTKAKAATKTSTSAKAAYKVPTRPNELFNPLVQSPVKMRVEAFENAAAAATEHTKRLLRNKKENVTPSSSTTPIIGKLAAPALGRFLTPTQSSNVAAVNSAVAKKVTTSASKAVPISKAISASSLQRSNSITLTKNLPRENSASDFRKDLYNLAEERKKQREQKHLLAAQQREAKERERAERMAKLAKEREEKRIMKKQQEQDQKKRELEEIQRKLRQQQEDEVAKMKAAKERELLLQMKQQQLAKQKMMPPPPKTASKYTFEMLHEDDSTDDEDKVSYKRPPPPLWSRSHVRGPIMLQQEYTPTAYIDSFFSVQPMTPDLKIIFPNIDARHLKRNSSVLWSTPPRYSELPKY